MIIEGLTITTIIGICALIAWYAKNKFQPDIEKAIEDQKKQENKLSLQIIKKQDLKKIK
ncbi:MAG: hypothetical protein ACRD8K_09220 [Nitrososphaeraceae archaeon]